MKYLSVFSPNAGKYGQEKTLYLDTFHAVSKMERLVADFLKNSEEENLIYIYIYIYIYAIKELPALNRITLAMQEVMINISTTIVHGIYRVIEFMSKLIFI